MYEFEQMGQIHNPHKKQKSRKACLVINRTFTAGTPTTQQPQVPDLASRDASGKEGFWQPDDRRCMAAFAKRTGVST